MKKVLVTGASGFLGHYVINELLMRDIEVVATSRSRTSVEKKTWYSSVKYIEHDIRENIKTHLMEKFDFPDAVIHLAWGNLADFKDSKHIGKELPAHYNFLHSLISDGMTNVTCTGTCLEYGLQEGQLKESMTASPIIPYAVAKKLLFDKTSLLKSSFNFSFKWPRIFYLYGSGQQPNALIPSLERALHNNASAFHMTAGDQVRDFLPVDKAAKYIVSITLQNAIEGVINCSSNSPVKVKDFVNNYLQIRGSQIELIFGTYPYPDYEPFRFWGDNSIIKRITHNECS